MTLITRRRQIAVEVGTEGTEPTWSNVETAANAAILLYEPTFEDGQEAAERNPVRSQIGNLEQIPTSRIATLTLTAELKGSGTAGTSPSIDKLLRACSMNRTINSGTASIGTVIKQPSSTGSGAVPVLAGTYTGTKSGRLEILVTGVVADTSITVEATFYPADGTTPLTDSFIQSADAAVALTGVAAGVTFDFGDPSTSTTGYVVGDNYQANIVSDEEVSVSYTNRDPDGSSNDVCVDISFFQDGRVHRVYSCRGTWTINGSVGEFGTIEFVMTGIPAETVDEALLTGIDYEDTVPVPFLNLQSTNILGGSACFSSVSIEQGNDVVPRVCATSEFGNEAFRVVGRNMTGTIDPEASLVADSDVFAKLRAGTTSPLNFTLGQTAGNIVQFASPRVQITAIGDESRDDILVDGLTLRFCQPIFSGTNEYSECTLTFR